MVHDPQSMRDPTRRAASVSNDTLQRLPRAERVPAAVERYTADRLRVTVDAPSAGWLLVTERWARGWRAAIDGRPTPIHGGNFVFRAVEISPGRHQLEFSYEPVALPWLTTVSWLTMFVVAVASVVWRQRD
jgi:uncharacterized membrane protein YfhO